MDSSEDTKKETLTSDSYSTTKVMIKKELAKVLKLYCVMKGKTMQEYVNEVVARELEEFRINMK